MIDLSVLIPARNEIFLARTIEDILQHAEADTEIIAVLDGYWPDPVIQDHPRVTLLHHVESIGQRAATNEAAAIANGKYVAKCDAHCAFDQGFDMKLLADMQDDWTVAPTMRNLHAFDWVCPNGHRRYQGPSGPCKECGEPTAMEMVWNPKRNPQSNAYCFDPTPHFQYMGEYSKRPEGKGDLTESMSLQGSFFMMRRDRYFDLNVCDESWGSWGSQGIEVAVKSWLSGGKVIINHKTFYGHMFRTQGGDFGFPYAISGRQVERAKGIARKTFFETGWPRQIHPLSWLVERFWPVPYWTDDDLKRLKESENGEVMVSRSEIPVKGILYYTCNTHPLDIEMACRSQLLNAKNGHILGCVSRDKETGYGDWELVVPYERSPLTMHRQILYGLEKMQADVVFLCESDVLYHPSHFDFTPPRDDTFYYNINVWRARYPDGHLVRTDELQQVSGCCAYRSLLLDFYRKRVEQIEKEGFNRHYEPGPKTGPYKTENWISECPNIDIRHGDTLTRAKWSPEEFRNPKYAKGWREASQVEGWDLKEGSFDKFLAEITHGESVWRTEPDTG